LPAELAAVAADAAADPAEPPGFVAADATAAGDARKSASPAPKADMTWGNGVGAARGAAADAAASPPAETAAAAAASARDAAKTPGEDADVAVAAVDMKKSAPPPRVRHVAGRGPGGGGCRGGGRRGSPVFRNCGGGGGGHRQLGGIARGGRHRCGGRRRLENVGPNRRRAQHVAGRGLGGSVMRGS